MLSTTQTEQLSELIADRYSTPETLAKQLELGIEMLFYLEDHAFDKREVQDVVYAIKGLVGVLRK